MQTANFDWWITQFRIFYCLQFASARENIQATVFVICVCNIPFYYSYIFKYGPNSIL